MDNQNELFQKSKKIAKKKSRLAIGLARYDKNSFNERLERLKFLKKIYPKSFAFSSDFETYYIFDEIKTVYVNGGLISTILLSQAFIERKLQMYFNGLGLERVSRKGLKAMLDYGRANELINNYFFNKVEELRKKRNPFTHLKEFEHESNLTQRFMRERERGKEIRQPSELLVTDANEAIRLAFAVLSNDFK